MDITLYGLKTCDTCKKARNALREAGYSIAYIDVRDDGVKVAELARFQCKFGADLVNKRSTTWRNLPEAECSRPALQLLSAYPSLMKRPVIVAGNDLFLGWSKSVQSKLGA